MTLLNKIKENSRKGALTTLVAALTACGGADSVSKDASWSGELPSHPGYTVDVSTRYFGNGESGESYHGHIYEGDSFKESLIVEDPFLDKGAREMLRVQHSSPTRDSLSEDSRLRDLSLKDIAYMMSQAVELAKARKDSLTE